VAGNVFAVIGGTTGMGLAIAQALRDQGARLVVVGLEESASRAAAEALGPDADVFSADATNSHTAVQAVQRARSRFGRLDGLCHVAGGSGRKWGDGPLHEMTDEGWRKTLELNLASVMYSNRAAVTYFLDQGHGTILNVASVIAWSPSPHFFATHAYAAAKAGIISLTRSCAAYYAPRNIRFNALAPGLTATPMSLRAQQNDQIQAYIRTKQPLDGGRMAQPDDLSGAAVFLLSDAARFVTGQVLAVDGGWEVSEGQRSPAPA
jgi:NAD(P)-dependent dehydrogenase (short-subunit alcohol dehydrogenase family)